MCFIGSLCGQCNEDYGVTLDLQSCVKIGDQAECIVGVVLFVALSCECNSVRLLFL